MTANRVRLLLALAIGVLLASVPQTLALLTDSAQATSTNSIGAGRIVSPSAPTVTATGLNSRTVTWTPTTVDTGAGPAPVSGYRVLRYTGATGGAGTQVCATPNGTTTCNLTGQPLIGYYSVVATFAANWSAEGPRGTVLGDTTAPSVGFTAPAAGASGGANTIRNSVRDACASGVACGTATDDVGVTLVEYQLERASGTLGLTRHCWDGGSWATGQCLLTWRAATRTTTDGLTTWIVPGDRQTAYPNNPAATITLRVRATDAAGNQTTSTITFTIT